MSEQNAYILQIFLFGILCCVFIISVITWIMWPVWKKEPTVKKLNKRIKMSSYQDVEEFLSTLLATNKEDWFYENNHMRYALSFNMYAHVYQSDEDVVVMDLKENNKENPLLRIAYSKKDNLFTIIKNVVDVTDDLVFQQIGEHVMAILTTYRQTEQEEKEKKKQEEFKKEEERNKQIKRELNYITHYLYFEENPLGHFSHKVIEKKHYTEVLFFFKDIMYAKANYTPTLDTIRMAFFQSEKLEGRVFKAHERALMAFVRQFVLATPHNEEEHHELLRKETSTLLDQVERIKQELTQLQQEKEWLSQESLHRVSETYPQDLTKLANVYRTVKENEVARMHVERSLALMKEKVASFQTEIIQNKLMKLQQIETLIEKRD